MLSPMPAAREYPSGPIHGGHVGCWVPDAEQTISHTRNRGAVKMTYYGPIFFCYCFVLFGVSRCLRCPPDGLWGLWGVI